ncbi:MAG: site-2 protease family protein [Blastocatellia bacterium]|nr:site-2 protease family protein [Blastocatellia bacterium]
MDGQESYTEIYYFEKPSLRPTFRTWVKHILLLLVTFATATVAGSLYPFGPFPILPESDPQTWPEVLVFVAHLPRAYIGLISGVVYQLATEPAYLIHGLSFSVSLLFILVAHEMGHYIACRIYRVDATLPYFLPTPPMIGPAGTFGAFIRIRSPFPTRKSIFDIGIAGPIAGFLALLPIAAIGVWTAQPAPSQVIDNYGGLVFADPLTMQILAAIAGVNLDASYGNAFYYAAWVGLLVTALNLIPAGQLDGGHSIYAVFGSTVHRWAGRVAFVIMAVLSVVGLLYFKSPSGFLIAVLLAVMLRIPHPEPWDDSPLDAKRKVLALVTLVVFILSFVPFPIRLVI